MHGTKEGLAPREQAEMGRVDGLAMGLRDHIDQTALEIAKLHVHGASSSSVQAHFSQLLKDQLGFREEVVLLRTA